MDEMLFPPEALALLRDARFDPDAKRVFESLSTSFVWSDERLFQVIRICRDHESLAFRSIMECRTSLIKSEPIEDYRHVWEQVRETCPEWPGFRPERSSTDLYPAWRRALKRMCIEFERELRNLEQDEVETA